MLKQAILTVASFLTLALLMLVPTTAQAQCRSCGRAAMPPAQYGQDVPHLAPLPYQAGLKGVSKKTATSPLPVEGDESPEMLPPEGLVEHPEFPPEFGDKTHLEERMVYQRDKYGKIIGHGNHGPQPRYHYSGSTEPYYYGRSYLSYPHYERWYTPPGDNRRKARGPGIFDWWK